MLRPRQPARPPTARLMAQAQKVVDTRLVVAALVGAIIDRVLRKVRKRGRLQKGRDGPRCPPFCLSPHGAQRHAPCPPVPAVTRLKSDLVETTMRVVVARNLARDEGDSGTLRRRRPTRNPPRACERAGCARSAHYSPRLVTWIGARSTRDHNTEMLGRCRTGRSQETAFPRQSCRRSAFFPNRLPPASLSHHPARSSLSHLSPFTARFRRPLPGRRLFHRDPGLLGGPPDLPPPRPPPLPRGRGGAGPPVRPGGRRCRHGQRARAPALRGRGALVRQRSAPAAHRAVPGVGRQESGAAPQDGRAAAAVGRPGPEWGGGEEGAGGPAAQRGGGLRERERVGMGVAFQISCACICCPRCVSSRYRF